MTEREQKYSSRTQQFKDCSVHIDWISSGKRSLWKRSSVTSSHRKIIKKYLVQISGLVKKYIKETFIWQ